MSALFGGLLKPGDAGRIAIQRELETRRDNWDRPGYLYRGAGDYLLQHGQYYQGRVLPDHYDHLRGQGGACFANALLAVKRDPSLRYVEGVYDTGGCHFTSHGWCIDANGEMVELTYPTKDLPKGAHNQLGFPILAPAHWSYWGVIFRPEFVEWFMDTYEEFCMFDRSAADRADHGRHGLDMSQNHDFPILKVPYDPARTTL